MLFNAATIFGLVAVATAAPQLHSRFQREVGQPAARGVTYNPLNRRQFGSFGNSFSAFGASFDVNSINALIAAEQIQILQLQQAILDQVALEQELLLTQAIALQLQANLELQIAQDNIRTNTFNALNSQVNTVAIIVTQVIDNRNLGVSNNRYLVRQLQSNPSVQQQAFVVIQEAATMTISNNIPSSVFAAAQASGTGFSIPAPSVGNYSPGQTIQLQQSGINLLPLGVQVPNFANAQVFNDPALIILPNQQAFVQAGNTQQFQISITEIQLSSFSSGVNAFDFSGNSAQNELAAQLLAASLNGSNGLNGFSKKQ